MDSPEEVNEKIQKLVYMYEMYEKKLNELVVFKEKLEKSIREYENLIESLEGLEEQKNGVILPIGKNTFVRAEKVDINNILVGVGANIVVEMTSQKAKEHIKELKSKIEGEIKKVEESINTFAKEIETLHGEMRKYGIL